MLEFVVKLTVEPQKMSAADLEALRTRGFDDYAISDIVQITGLFAYYNRLADGLGIDDEPEWGEAR
jgi:alkylhydroperoxidase family enzyme